MNFSTKIILGSILLMSSTFVTAQDSTFHVSEKDTIAFVQIVQDPRIDIINSYYKEVSSADTMVEGYRIQIYFGSREKANRRIGQFKEYFPEVYAKIIYEEPNFKTVVGGYQTKLDADRELIKFQEEFPDAFIIRNRIRKE